MSNPLKGHESTVEAFFDYARERYNVFVRRRQGEPKPWTDDPILRAYRFTNIFREDDATTVWFRNKVRAPMSERPEVLLATVLFRWFNRIETGETLFLQPDMLDGRTAWESFLRHHRAGRTAHGVSILRTALKRQGPPWITGSYIVNTHGKYGDGKSKLDGVLAQFRAFAEQSDWEHRVEYFSEDKTLREFCEWMQGFYGMGGFMAYEVTSDLRWTRILREAPDINSWANPGLGAKRGASRVLQRGQRPGREGKRPKPARISDAEALEVMQHLHINHGIYWPREWPRWEMREVEHTLCEFDKYERVRLGEGTPRRLFDGGVT